MRWRQFLSKILVWRICAQHNGAFSDLRQTNFVTQWRSQITIDAEQKLTSSFSWFTKNHSTLSNSCLLVWPHCVLTGAIAFLPPMKESTMSSMCSMSGNSKAFFVEILFSLTWGCIVLTCAHMCSHSQSAVSLSLWTLRISGCFHSSMGLSSPKRIQGTICTHLE